MTQQHMVVRGPEHAVALSPLLLGFTPEDSLVAVWISNGSVALTQRVDLPQPDSDLRAFAQTFVGLAAHAHPQSVVVLIYPPDGPQIRYAQLVDALLADLDDAGIDVLDVLLVHGPHFESALCDGECCPPEGRVLSQEVNDEVAAAFALAGVAPLASRADVVASLSSDPKRVHALAAGLKSEARRLARARAKADAVEQWRDQCIADIGDLLASESAVGDTDLARLVHGLADIRVRDTVLWMIAGLDERAGALTVLVHGLRAAPSGLVAPIATCAGMCAWFMGDGARAAIAVDRARADDPGYALAQMLEQAVHAGLPPAQWAQALRDLPIEDIRLRSPAA